MKHAMPMLSAQVRYDPKHGTFDYVAYDAFGRAQEVKPKPEKKKDKLSITLGRLSDFWPK